MSPMKVIVLAALVGLCIAVVSMVLSYDLPGLLLNLGTEIMGAALIYLIFDRLIGGRESDLAALRQIEAHKKDLIARMGSRVHDVAIAAVEELTRCGWLTDGSLQGAPLWEANLQGAPLSEADLQGANLMVANLQRANLFAVDLRGANLLLANLQGANLQNADLQGAGLVEANLQGAQLLLATFDENTTLPDDTKWTPDTDMARFTDPEHPDFWPSSAYGPKEQE